MQQLISRREGGDVKRFHTVTMLRENLVSSHSFGVALIALHINPEASANLLKACLFHDLEEKVTGDMPATTKWRYPELAGQLKRVEEEVAKELGLEITLSKYEQEVLKVADMGDLVLNCIDEYNLGNKKAWDIVTRGLVFLTDRVSFSDTRQFVFDLRKYAQEVRND